MNIEIRKATVSDAKSAVEVNTYTWLTTYKGLISDAILESRVNDMNDRIAQLEKSILENNNMYIAQINGKTVGIMSYGKSRNSEYTVGEIYSIYVLKDYQGLGIGKKLLIKGMQELINMGYQDMFLNVLEGNKAIHFYEKFGGKKIGTKDDYFNNEILKENIMYFTNIKEIVNTNIESKKECHNGI